MRTFRRFGINAAAVMAMAVLVTATGAGAAEKKPAAKPSEKPQKVMQVPRYAPDFTFAGVGGKKSLRSLRGQPVVLVVAKSPKARTFRKQLKMLGSLYQEFASRKVVFVAAFSEEQGEVQSDIPFVVATDGPAVAAAYDLRGDLTLAVIGPDGNLDLISGNRAPAGRIREVITNSFQTQNEARKVTPRAPQ